MVLVKIVSCAKIDLLDICGTPTAYCMLHFFQVNYSPYFFDLHLKYEINDCKTRVVMADNKITFHLVKLEPTLWETLVNPLAKDSAKRFVF